MAKKQEENPADTQAMGVSPGGDVPPVYPESAEPDPLDEESLVKMFNGLFALADQHRKPREAIWDLCWNLYNNEYDWSDKAWWQHRTPIPKVRTAVDRAVAMFRKTLLKVQPFYGIQAESKLGRQKGRYTMLLTDYWLDQSRALEELVTAFKVGLITSNAITKIWWERVKDTKPGIKSYVEEVPTYEYGVATGYRPETKYETFLEENVKGKLGIKCMNPRNLWIVPGTNNRCIIERDECLLSDIYSLTKRPGNPDGIYEEDAYERLAQRASVRKKRDDESNYQNETKVDGNDYLKLVELWHYWGDIYDCQGQLIMCDASFTLAQGDILIRKPRSNPFFHKKAPYVIGSPYIIPFSTYNRGMVEDIAEIAKSITELACLIADGGMYDAMKAFSIDIDQLDDPSEARQGLSPGKTFLRRSGQAGTPNEKLIQTVEVGHVPAEAMNTVNMFEKYFQEGSFVNEWVAGFGGKGERTLGEVNIKTQSALEGLDESARNLEVTLLEPSLDMATRVIYQYNSNFMLERLTENYPQLSMLLQDMQPAERYSTMVGDYAFKVRGLSVMIDRAQRIGELKEVLQLLSYLPGFLERLNPDAALEEILMPLGWDPQRLLLSPGGNAVTTPMAGAVGPSAAMMPPGQAPLQTQNAAQGARGPMARRNAAEGAAFGGARQNPMARPGPGQLPPQIMQLIQGMMGGRR